MTLAGSRRKGGFRFLTRLHPRLRVPQPPGGGQDGGEHPDPTGRQPGAAVELQRLRRESGGLPEDRRGPVRAQAADVEYLHG